MLSPTLTPGMNGFCKQRVLKNRHREVRVRIARAFRSLRKQGFIARMDYGCCRSCAGGELDALINARNAKGANITMYVYFTRQGTESLKDGHDLYLSYGAPAMSPARTEDAGHLLKDALVAEGLTVEWDGSPAMCVKIIFWGEITEMFPKGSKVLHEGMPCTVHSVVGRRIDLTTAGGTQFTIRYPDPELQRHA